LLLEESMRLSTLRLTALCLLAAAACTTDQDLGHHADGGAGDGDSDSTKHPGDSNPSKGDGSNPGSGDGDTSIDPPLNNGDGDDGSAGGQAQPFDAVTAGALSFSNNYQQYGVSLTTMGGTDGCALVGAQDAAPGTKAARVVLHVQPKGSDKYCPDGIYAITNDPDGCAISWGGSNGLPPGCAMYERWNAQGEVEARVPGVGGSMSVKATEDTTVGTGHWFCHVELTVRLRGGVSVSDTFDYDYYTQADENTFCAQ
jgi:hypothetical protein